MIAFGQDEVAEIRGFLDGVGSDEWIDYEEILRLDRLKALLDARLNGQPDPPPIPEEEIAQARHPQQVRESTGTYWVWRGGLDGEYVDTGKPVDSLVMMLHRANRQSVPFMDLIGRGSATPGTKLEWGYQGSEE